MANSKEETIVASTSGNEIERRCLLSQQQLQEIKQSLNNTIETLNSVSSPKTATPAKSKRFDKLNELVHTKFIYGVAHHILLVTLICQVILITTLSALDTQMADAIRLRQGVGYTISVALIVLISIVNGSLLVTTHYAVVHQVVHQRTVGGHITKSFVSSILLFAAIISYTIHREPTSWTFKSNAPPTDGNFIRTYYRVLIFCISSGTFQSIDDNISPNAWYAYLVIGIQMVVSFGHPVSMFAHFAKEAALSRINPPKTTPFQNNHESAQLVKHDNSSYVTSRMGISLPNGGEDGADTVWLRQETKENDENDE